jgi:uncharacterized membrane protein
MRFTRYLLKAISWRVIGIVITGTIAFLITGSMALAGSIAGIDASFKIVAFMFHEWLWERKRVK